MMTGGKIIGVYEDDELNGAIKMDIEHYFTETGNGEHREAINPLPYANLLMTC